ncbi:MAG: bluB [Ilumatobacteraceae bacterium]|nr:bluB [Ilumatobacteraceae bacterium]MCU1389100.1 bluB [Ilumatobacteraceae bacterium]
MTASVLDAATAGTSMGAAAAAASQLACKVIDAGSSTGDLAATDAMTTSHTKALIELGTRAGRRLFADQLVVVGEVGIGNTTVAAALTAALLGIDATSVVGLGSGADSAMIRRKQDVVAAALKRWRNLHRRADDAVDLLRTLGGPEFAVICGIVVGVAECGGVVVLDGLATSVAAAIACTMSPAASGHLVAGQRSNEMAHPLVLRRLGLEPVLDLRLRAGEGVGAVLATRLLLDGLEIRRTTARTEERRLHFASSQHDPQ